MTLRDRVLSVRPDAANNMKGLGGVSDCPSFHVSILGKKYQDVDFFNCDKSYCPHDTDICEECWSQEWEQDKEQSKLPDTFKQNIMQRFMRKE